MQIGLPRRAAHGPWHKQEPARSGHSDCGHFLSGAGPDQSAGLLVSLGPAVTEWADWGIESFACLSDLSGR